MRGNGKCKVPTTIVTAPNGVREDGTTPIAAVEWRQRVRVRGRVQALRVEALAGTPGLECTIVDDTGGVAVIFYGRRHIEGVEIGAVLTAEGMAIDHHGRLAIVNPMYELK